MTSEEIKRFKEEVADPRMRQIFAKTEIPEGACFVDSVSISFLDGRSHGVDTLIEASGLRYVNGQAIEYRYEMPDVNVSEFMDGHKGCQFIFDGKLRIYDELDGFEVNTDLRNYGRCFKVFEGIERLAEMDFAYEPLVYMKLKALFKGDPLVQVEKREEEPVTIMNAAAIEYKGIIFDDWSADSDGVWANVCQCCAEKYGDLISGELDDSAIGICSVDGCDVSGLESENEHHYYIDMNPELVHPLTKEQYEGLRKNGSLEEKIMDARRMSKGPGTRDPGPGKELENF